MSANIRNIRQSQTKVHEGLLNAQKQIQNSFWLINTNSNILFHLHTTHMNDAQCSMFNTLQSRQITAVTHFLKAVRQVSTCIYRLWQVVVQVQWYLAFVRVYIYARLEPSNNEYVSKHVIRSTNEEIQMTISYIDASLMHGINFLWM